jgi:hypothetical protein
MWPLQGLLSSPAACLLRGEWRGRVSSSEVLLREVLDPSWTRDRKQRAYKELSKRRSTFSCHLLLESWMGKSWAAALVLFVWFWPDFPNNRCARTRPVNVVHLYYVLIVSLTHFRATHDTLHTDIKCSANNFTLIWPSSLARENYWHTLFPLSFLMGIRNHDKNPLLKSTASRLWHKIQYCTSTS